MKQSLNFETLEAMLKEACREFEENKIKSSEEFIQKVTGAMKHFYLIIKFENVPIEELKLSSRPYHAFKKSGINTIAQIINHSEDELLTLKNGFGKKALFQTKQALNKYGLDVRNPSYEITQKTAKNYF